jgi:hypothetical protein
VDALSLASGMQDRAPLCRDEIYGRAGYRFGRTAAPFVVLDYGAQLHVGYRDNLLTGLVDATWVRGPTFGIGYTF